LIGGHGASCVFANKNPTHFVCSGLVILTKSIEMGRPKKELKSLKIIQVNARMTTDEYLKVATNAETLGITIAQYIRKTCTGKSLPTKKINPLDRELFVQLSRIGNNLNQLTKVYNSGIRDPFNIKEQLIELKDLLTFLKSNISDNDR
jgi:hypothetical protein